MVTKPTAMKRMGAKPTAGCLRNPTTGHPAAGRTPGGWRRDWGWAHATGAVRLARFPTLSRPHRIDLVSAYSQDDLYQALRAIESMLGKLEKSEGDLRSQGLHQTRFFPRDTH